jgi:metal-responsive CopG/Arc/MetJ family transcriptional regulator
MPTTQVAVRLDAPLLERLDWLVARRDFENRAEAIRAAVIDLARRERDREIDEQIVAGYRRLPQTDREAAWVGSRGWPGLPDDDWSALL